jgi:hypothetical protein
MSEAEGSLTDKIDLRSPLTLRNSFLFPLQSKDSRRELIIGGLWLLVPVVGWLMNMGHRIRMVHNMHKGQSAWPAWTDSRDLLKHGFITALGMIWYGWPGVSLVAAGSYFQSRLLLGAGIGLWVLAVIAIPGYMSHYCKELDVREIFDPFRALRRVFQGGLGYMKVWLIVLLTMLLSFAGLLAFGVGFLFTSVWFWQAAGFSFATCFTQRFDLDLRSKE